VGNISPNPKTKTKEKHFTIQERDAIYSLYCEGIELDPTSLRKRPLKLNKLTPHEEGTSLIKNRCAVIKEWITKWYEIQAILSQPHPLPPWHQRQSEVDKITFKALFIYEVDEQTPKPSEHSPSGKYASIYTSNKQKKVKV